jgi:hydrogenase maturation protease
MNAHKPLIVVMGIGNPLRCDDGVGISVIRKLVEIKNSPGVCFMDGGTSPDLPSMLEPNIEKLVIVDALRGGKDPGHIYRLEIDESNIAEQVPGSVHGLGVLNGLKMMKMLGTEPHKVVLVGIEPSDTSPGLSLSPLIASRLTSLMEAVEDEIMSPY